MSKRIRNVLKRILVFSLVAVLLVGCGPTTEDPVDSSVETTDDANANDDVVADDTTTEDVAGDDAATEDVVEDDATTEDVVEDDATTEEVVEEDNLDTALYVYDGVNNKQIDIPVVDLLPEYVAGDTIRVTAVMSGDGGYTGGLGICKGDNFEWNQVDYAHFDGGQHTWEMVVTPSSPDIAVMVWTVEGTYVILKDIKVVKADPSEIVEEAPVEIDLDYTFDGAANRQIDIPVTSVLPGFQYGDAIKVTAVLSGDGGYAGGLGICVGSNYEWNQVQYDCWDGGTNTWEMVVVPSSPDVAVMVWTVQGTYVHLDSFTVEYADGEEAEKAEAASKELSNLLTNDRNAPGDDTFYWTPIRGYGYKHLWVRDDVNGVPEGLDPDPRQFTIDLTENPEYQPGARIKFTVTIGHNSNFVVDLVSSTDAVPGWHPLRVQEGGYGLITKTWELIPNQDWMKVCCWWMEGNEVSVVDYKIEVMEGGKTAPTVDFDDILNNATGDVTEFVEEPVTAGAGAVAVTVEAEDLGLANMRTNDTIVVEFASDEVPVLWLFHPAKGAVVVEPSYVSEGVSTFAADAVSLKKAVFTAWDMQVAVGSDLAEVTEVMVVAGAAETTVTSVVVSGETIEVVNNFSGTETFSGTGSFTINVVEGLGSVEVGDVIKVDLTGTIDSGDFNADVIVANNLVDGVPTYFVNRFADGGVRENTYYYVVGNPTDFTVKVQMDYMTGGECTYNYTVSRTDLSIYDVRAYAATLTGLGSQTITLPELPEGKAYDVYAVLKGNSDLRFAGTVGGATFDASGWDYANGIVDTIITTNELVVDITTYTSASGKTIPCYITVKVVDAPAEVLIGTIDANPGGLDSNPQLDVSQYVFTNGIAAGDDVEITAVLKIPATGIVGAIADNNDNYDDSINFKYNTGDADATVAPAGEVTVTGVIENIGNWVGIQNHYSGSEVIKVVSVSARKVGAEEPAEIIGTLGANPGGANTQVDLTQYVLANGIVAGDDVEISVVLDIPATGIVGGIVDNNDNNGANIEFRYNTGEEGSVAAPAGLVTVTGTINDIGDWVGIQNWYSGDATIDVVSVTARKVGAEEPAAPFGTVSMDANTLSIMSVLADANVAAGDSVVITVNMEAEEWKMYKGVLQFGKDSAVVLETGVEEVTNGGVGAWTFEIDSLPADYNWAQICLHWCEVPVTVKSVVVEKVTEEEPAAPFGTVSMDANTLSIMSVLADANVAAGDSVVITVNMEAEEWKMYKGVLQFGKDSAVVLETGVEEVTNGGVGAWTFEIDSLPADYNWAQICLHWCEVPVTVNSVVVQKVGNNSASAAALIDLLGL